MTDTPHPGRWLADIHDEHENEMREAPARWRPWVLDLDTYSLEYDGYQFPLDELTDSAHILDWIYQIHGKRLGTPEVMSALLQAIDDIYHPQARVCSFGIDTKRTKDEVRAHIRELATRYAWA